MRAVGAVTQAAIDSRTHKRAIRASIYDEADVEIPIPFDAIAAIPRVETDFDVMVWRLTGKIVETVDTKGVVLRGRKIRMWEYWDPAEELDLFRGFIADVRSSMDYSDGTPRKAYDIECVGELSRKFDAHLTRFEWRPAPMNPDAASPYSPLASETVKLTGIIKTYRATFAYPAGAPWLGLPITMPFFPTSGLEEWARVYTADNGQELHSSFWDLRRNATTGVIEFNVPILSPQSYIIDIMAVDRWVILKNRKYHNGVSAASIVPSFQLLSGIAGQSDAERLNDPATTTLRLPAQASSTSIMVDRPEGIFASGVPWTAAFGQDTSLPAHTSADRWLSVWVGGVEYRGKVQAVDKNPDSVDYGKITLFAAFPLRRLSNGALLPAVVGGEEVANTSTVHYELLDPGVRSTFTGVGAGGTEPYYARFKAAAIGGFFLYGFQGAILISVIPETSWDGPTPTLLNGAWLIYASSAALVIDSAEVRPVNDVAEFVKTALLESGTALSDIDVATSSPSLFTLAPFTRANINAGTMIQEALKATVPPTFRIRETEAGKVIYGFIAQKSIADLSLVGMKSFAPREMPRAITRAIVRGKTIETNRAGQFFQATTVDSGGALLNPERVFNNIFGKETTDAASAIGVQNVKILFRIPPTEPGRSPLISKLIATFDNQQHLHIGGSHLEAGPFRYLERDTRPNDGSSAFVKVEYADFASILHGREGPEGRSYLQAHLADNGSSVYLDEIQVFAKEGAYWEAGFTDADGLSRSNALNFDGVDDQVSFPSATYFTGDFTVEMWIQISTWKGTIFAFRGAAGAEVVIQLNPADGKMTVFWSNDGVTFAAQLVTPDHFYLDVPTHLAITLSGTAATFYRNGRVWLTQAVTAAPAAIARTSNFIGRSITGDFFAGIIDDLRIWNVARTQAEIRNAMFSSLVGTETGLIGLWKMDEGTGLTINDATANARHGTITGTTWTKLSRRRYYSTADQGVAKHGKVWTKPVAGLAMSFRYVTPAWLQRNMADFHSGLDRVEVIEAEGVTVSQAREIAEATLDHALRSSEFFDWRGPYDPRVQLGDTVEQLSDDGTTRLFTVYGISKEEKGMALRLADYSL